MEWNEWCWVLIQRKNSDVTLRSSSVLKRKSVCVRAYALMATDDLECQWLFFALYRISDIETNSYLFRPHSIASIFLHCVPIHFESKNHDFFSNNTNRNGQVYSNWVSLNCPSRLRVFVYFFFSLCSCPNSFSATTVYSHGLLIILECTKQKSSIYSLWDRYLWAFGDYFISSYHFEPKWWWQTRFMHLSQSGLQNGINDNWIWILWWTNVRIGIYRSIK